jgi:Tfp pilus assembly protein PilF
MSEQHFLEGRHVAFAGRFLTMTHAEAEELLKTTGAVLDNTVHSTTEFVVLGSFNLPVHIEHWPAQTETINEKQFLLFCNEEERAKRLDALFTLNQLARILHIPLSRLRSWVRKGWIKPTQRENRLLWFSFGDCAWIRQLASLIDEGLEPDSLLPYLKKDRERVLSILPKLKTRAGKAVLEKEGLLQDVTGQLLIPLGPYNPDSSQKNEAALSPIIPLASVRQRHQDKEQNRIRITAEDLFCQALESEEEGLESEAMDLYARAVELDAGIPEIHFNYGNLMLEQGLHMQASRQYLKAVSLDEDYAEAWNNLGHCLIQMDSVEEAQNSFEQAISVEPGYADAWYNLGCLFLRKNDAFGAREKFKKYLEIDSYSPLADEVRRLIDNIAREKGSFN